PRFDEKDFKRVKKQLKENLRNESNIPDMVADKLYDNLIFGNTPMGSYVTEKNIKRLSLDDVKNYYNQYYSPSVTKVVVVGDVSESDALKKFDFLNQWKAKEVKMPEPDVVKASFPKEQPTQIYF